MPSPHVGKNILPLTRCGSCRAPRLATRIQRCPSFRLVVIRVKNLVWVGTSAVRSIKFKMVPGNNVAPKYCPSPLSTTMLPPIVTALYSCILTFVSHTYRLQLIPATNLLGLKHKSNHPFFMNGSSQLLTCLLLRGSFCADVEECLAWGCPSILRTFSNHTSEWNVYFISRADAWSSIPR